MSRGELKTLIHKLELELQYDASAPLSKADLKDIINATGSLYSILNRMKAAGRSTIK